MSIYTDKGFKSREDYLDSLANELEDDCEDSMELLPTAGPFADILNAGIGRINWREIAENMLSE